MAKNTALRKWEKQENKKKTQTMTKPFQNENKETTVGQYPCFGPRVGNLLSHFPDFTDPY